MAKYRAEYTGRTRDKDIYELTLENTMFNIKQTFTAEYIQRTWYAVQLRRDLHRSFAVNIPQFAKMFSRASTHMINERRTFVIISEGPALKLTLRVLPGKLPPVARAIAI